MSALILKDRTVLLVFFLGGVITLGAVAESMGFHYAFVFPETNFERHMFHVWWPLALGFGLLVSVLDELQGTTAYLRHRPVSTRRLFAARMIGCGVVLAAWLILPLAFVAVFSERSFTPSYVEVGGQKVLAGTVVFSSFAVGMFAGTFSSNWIVRLLVGAFLAIPLLMWADATIGGWRIDPPDLWVLGTIHLSIAAILLFGALANESAGRDADLPFPGRAMWCLAIALLGLLWLGHTALGEMTQNLRNDANYPQVAIKSDGKYGLVRRVWRSGSRNLESVFVDEEQNDLEPATGYELIPGYRERWPENVYRGDRIVRRHSSRSFPSKTDLESFTTYTHSPKGFMRHYLERRGPIFDVLTLGRGSATDKFSIHARAADVHGLPKFVIGDPEDGGIWVCDLSEPDPEYSRITLPGGDRFVAFRWVGREHRPILQNLLRDLHGREIRDGEKIPSIEHVVLGERGMYTFDPLDNSITPLTDELAEEIAAARNKSQPKHRLHWVDKDPIFPIAEVRDLAGNVLYAHPFHPRTLQQWGVALALFGQSLLRSPILQTVGFVRGQEYSLVSDGKYSWLLRTHWILCAVVAFFVRRRLHSLGATASRQGFWIAAVLIVGLPASVLYRLVETDRAYRRCRLLPSAPSESLLIRPA